MFFQIKLENTSFPLSAPTIYYSLLLTDTQPGLNKCSMTPQSWHFLLSSSFLFSFLLPEYFLSVSFKYSVATSDNLGWNQGISLLVTVQIAAWERQPAVESGLCSLQDQIQITVVVSVCKPLHLFSFLPSFPFSLHFFRRHQTKKGKARPLCRSHCWKAGQ